MTAGGREWGREEGRRERGSRLSGSQTPSQSFPRAPEPLAARAAGHGTGAPREPVQGGRGAAAAVHAAGSGCPAPGTTRGEVRRGGRRPLQDADRQVSRAARAPCSLPARPRPGPAPAASLAPSGPRAGGRREGAVGVSGAPRGCARTGLGEPAAPGPCDGCASFPLFPSWRICSVPPAPALTPPPSNSETLGTVNLGRPGVAARALWVSGEGTGESPASPCAPSPASPVSSSGLEGQLVSSRSARLKPQPGASATLFSRKPQIRVCVSAKPRRPSACGSRSG